MFSSTRFAQMLQALPHQLFKASVKRCDADRHAKQFTSWDLLITLIYDQIIQAKSLRTLANAVHLQIYSALISYLLLHLFHRRSGFTGSLFLLTVRISHVLHERPATPELRDRRRQEREKLKAAQGSIQL